MKKTPKLRFHEFSDEWEKFKLKELIDKNYIVEHLDGNHGELYPKSEEFVDDGIKYISANSLINGKVDLSKVKHLTFERGATFKKGVSKSNDVLLAHNATVGPVGLLETDDDYVILSTTVTYYRCNIKYILPKYLVQYMQTMEFQQQLFRVMKQSTRNQVPIMMQRELCHSIPSLSEQNKLSSFYSLIDKKIEKQQEKVEALAEYKNGIMQKIFSQKIRFKDENGEAYPKWKKVDFKNLFEEVKEKTSDTEKYKLYSLTIENGVVPKSERYEREFLVTKEEENYKIVHKNEYVYNPMNLRFGALARHIGENPVSVSGYYNIFETIDNCSYGFLDNFLKTNRMMYIYNTIATGSLVEKRRVHFSQFIELSLPMPSIKEQGKIADLLLTIDKKLNIEKEKLDQLKEWKKGLLQQMFV